MKGIEILSSLLAILLMMGMGGLLGGIVIYVLNAATTPLSSKITYEMYLSPIYPPVKYETMLMSYLESTTLSGFKIKKLLIYAAYQRNVSHIYIDNATEVTDLQDTSYDAFNQWLEGNGYILALNVGGEPYIITENRRAIQAIPNQVLKIKRISLPLYVDAEMARKVSKNREPPLNVTLDFYVQ